LKRVLPLFPGAGYPLVFGIPSSDLEKGGAEDINIDVGELRDWRKVRNSAGCPLAVFECDCVCGALMQG
jgi:hypothetical protein